MRINLPISFDVSDETAEAIGKGAQALKTAMGLLDSMRKSSAPEEIAQAIAAARKVGRRRRAR